MHRVGSYSKNNLKNFVENDENCSIIFPRSDKHPNIENLMFIGPCIILIAE